MFEIKIEIIGSWEHLLFFFHLSNKQCLRPPTFKQIELEPLVSSKTL